MKLFRDQRDAVDRLRSGSVLFGGVGSGKSVAALAYFHDKVCDGNCEEEVAPKKKVPLYIITTAKKRDLKEWDLDLARFGMSTDDNTLIKMPIVIDSWNNIKKYREKKNSFFIFDEQCVTGKGAWVKSFLRIVKLNQWIMLSATPGDKWEDYIPIFIANGFYKNRRDFSDQHLVYDMYAKYPKVRAYMNVPKLERERKKVLVKMEDRRSTTRKHITVHVDYNKENYGTIVRKRFNPYLGKPVKNVSQYCALQRYAAAKGKYRPNAIADIAKKHKKVIVFYNFDYELEDLLTLRDRLPGYKINQYNGHAHDDLPTGTKWLYLVNYGSGDKGWNCTKTDTLVYYSLPYSYRKFEQAAGRIDRINTPYTTLYYYILISHARIDGKVQLCIRRKQNFNVLDEESDFNRKRR